MDESFLPYRVAAAYLSKKLEDEGMDFPQVGVICGSGLSELSKALEGQTLAVKYSDIPGFPAHCTVAGHKGEVVFGNLSGVPACCFRGRFHSYEGHDMKTVVLPVTVMRCLKVKIVIVTNAAGGLNPDYKVGDVVCVSDHLAIPQLAGKNPLVGPNDEELGPRFPATSNAYNEDLRKSAKTAADEMGIDFLKTHGTYCFVSGPMYESKAECRFLRTLGGDCVGMSTIPEVVTAHHCNMQVLCLSLITNKVIMEGDEGVPVANHAEVLEAVGKRSVQMQGLVKKVIEVLKRELLPKIPELSPVNLRSAELQHQQILASQKVNGMISVETLAFGAACAIAGSFFTKMARN
ncbi:purine nucleoside phosphorylase [Nitzschia inconspicua]|uniref:Purine nucleoside phosphorylase n=1 Tax=Nitzschia inconspicua TaxID=303405 RepID=A0A9K3LLZ3_9STRA|nr:purine nucleoside phosphorylase [Nitzschia inconspicua]